MADRRFNVWDADTGVQLAGNMPEGETRELLYMNDASNETIERLLSQEPGDMALQVGWLTVEVIDG